MADLGVILFRLPLCPTYVSLNHLTVVITVYVHIPLTSHSPHPGFNEFRGFCKLS